MLKIPLYTALITPFIDEEVNYDGFSRNIQDQINADIKGLLIFGTTGESPTLSLDEKSNLLHTLNTHRQPDISLMVGIGTNCTKQTIHLAKHAESLKADCLLAITPYYNKPSQEGIYHHFKYIAENTTLPIVLYNHPGRSGQNIGMETLIKLMTIPNIVGLKDASGSLEYIQKLLYAQKQVRSDFLIYSGDDLNALPFMSLGAHGLISVASNLIPQTILKWVQLMLNHDYNNALKMHSKLYKFFEALCIETNPAPIKAAMNLCGKAAGSLRLPLVDLQEKNQEYLKQIINQTPSVYGEAQPKYSQTAI